MHPSLEKKLMQLMDRYEELGALLSDPQTLNDRDQVSKLSKEYAELTSLAEKAKAYTLLQEEKKSTQALLGSSSDADMVAMAEEEIQTLHAAIDRQEAELQAALLPKDDDDKRDVFLEIRAGTGGDEAAIFAGDLFRMYTRYAERVGFRVEIISENSGEHGGYKEVIMRVSGVNVYGTLKFESGTHRVQRVPATEAQGRIHTSACTVAVLPEAEEVGDIDISPSDLKIDTYRASGAGGQHVNKTDSAIRITYLPTGLVVECQEERSQHKNRARAMSLLKTRLRAEKQTLQQNEQAHLRKSLVGSGDRSERIRTYNFPQNRLTDHRVNVTLYQLEDIMEGALEDVIAPLQREHQLQLLADLAGEG